MSTKSTSTKLVDEKLHPNPPPVEVPYQPKVWSPKALPPPLWTVTLRFFIQRSIFEWRSQLANVIEKIHLSFSPWKRKTTEKNTKNGQLICWFFCLATQKHKTLSLGTLTSAASGGSTVFLAPAPRTESFINALYITNSSLPSTSCKSIHVCRLAPVM